MDIKATLSQDEVCIGSTFTMSVPRARIADVIIFGNRASGFVIRARDDELVIDIKTAVLKCKPVFPSNAKNVWEISELSVSEGAN